MSMRIIYIGISIVNVLASGGWYPNPNLPVKILDSYTMYNKLISQLKSEC